jgi:plasmid stabilization system protein ParE
VKRRFRLTPEAKADLREVLLDIAEDSPDTAERLRSEAYEAFQHLGQRPGIGHYHEELLDRRDRFWNFYSYIICYVWERKPIQIIAVVHGARHLASFFNSRIRQE